jgi:hypothetical protein
VTIFCISTGAAQSTGAGTILTQVPRG